MDYTMDIKGHALEFFDDGHIYLVDGVRVPSITEMLSVRFGHKYQHVDKDVLQRASAKGTEVHEAIEDYCVNGVMSELPEVRNFIFLKRQYGFQVIGNEVPVILFMDDVPISAGRIDLILEMDGVVGGADIKRTSALDKDYLFYQLNLYRMAYSQCYGTSWGFLRGVQLREQKRRYVPIPINEEMAWEIVNEWRKANEQS